MSIESERIRLGSVGGGVQYSNGLQPGGALTRTVKSDVPHGRGTSLFTVVPGISKGAASSLRHTTLLARSCVLYLSTDWRLLYLSTDWRL